MQKYAYIVTVVPGPRWYDGHVMEGIEVSRYPKPVQELSAIGDTVYRRFIGFVSSDEEAEELAMKFARGELHG
jgi:hypothetical protein